MMKRLLGGLIVLGVIIGAFFQGSVVLGDENGNQNTQTVNKPTTGDLTIHKYLYDGTEGATGTGDKNQGAPNGAVPIRGVSFSIYKVGALQKVSDDDPSDAEKVKFAQIPGGDQVSYTYTTNAVTAHVTIPGSSEPVQYTYSLSLATQNGKPVNPPYQTTDDTGLIKYEGLDAAEYFVIENLSASTGAEIKEDGTWKKVNLIQGIAPFVVAVPMTVRTGNNAGTHWESDVHVYPKNRASESLKTVDHEDGVNVGDTLTYEVGTGIPNSTEFKQFVIWDQLDKGLTFETGSLEIYEAKITTDAGKQVINKIGAALDSNLWTFSGPDANNKITVSFDKTGIEALEKLDNNQIVVVFKAKINEHAKRVPLENINQAEDIGNIIENKAVIELTRNDGTQVEETNIVKTRLGELEIIKAKVDGSLLEGAEFKISNSQDLAERGIFIKKATDGTLHYPDATTGRYAADDARHDEIKALPDYTAVSTKVTDPDDNKEYAVAHFSGLQAANKDNNFEIWIAETKAPPGYQLLDKVFSAQFKGESEEGKAGQANAGNYVWDEKVTNQKGFVLPKTGGFGMIVSLVAGIVVLGLGILFLMGDKRITR